MPTGAYLPSTFRCRAALLRWAALVGALVAPALVSTSAQAQEGVALNQFDPAPAGDRAYGVQSPDVRGHMRLRAMALIDYAHNPLVLRDTGDKSVYGSVVTNQLWLHLAPSLALWDRLLLSLDAPIAVAQSGDNPSGGGLAAASPDSTQMGDLRLGARARVLGPAREGMQLGVGFHLWLPTGARDSYVSDGSTRGSPFVVFGGNFDRLAWSAQVGAMLRPGQKLAGTPLGNGMTFGAALMYLVDSKKTVQIGPEIYGQTVLAQDGKFFGSRSTLAEALASARWRPGGGDWVVGAGVGPGIGRGAGTPDFRAVASVAFSPEKEPPPPAADRDGDGVPDSEDACPDEPGVRTSDPKTNGCKPPPGDKDGDGIPDDKDACPEVAGVKTNDPKTNGCPPDKDKDGVPDSVDACPDVAGVKTDDPKTNGCPPDKDKDGIPDSVDACPDVAGVKTDDPKTNGCPPDLDKDGVPDVEDACPKLPGPRHAEKRFNGCPQVHVTEEQIVITQQIQFETAKAVIRPESDGILRDVASILKKHPEISQLEVGGHTDNTGPAGLNRVLSGQRAKAVVTWLTKNGIEAKRLSSKGYGPDKPIADNNTEEGRAKNRRVEFKIMKTSDTPSNTKGGGK